MKIKYYILSILASFTMSSCLTSDLEDLPEHDVAEITGVNKVTHRYYDQDNKWVDGQPIVVDKQLVKESVVINKENATAVVTVKAPVVGTPDNGGRYTDGYSPAEKAKINTNNMVVVFDIYQAARMNPIEGSPKPGVPGDWSVPRKFEVKAASGRSVVWTVTVILVP